MGAAAMPVSAAKQRFHRSRRSKRRRHPGRWLRHDDDGPFELSEADRAPLEEAEQAAKGAGARATTHLLVGDPAHEIAAYADSQHADMIVVGSRGHGAIASALLRSVSRGVLRESQRPVFVVRGRAPGDTETGSS